MIRISELHKSDDDSMEQLNLDDYDEYLSDNMEATPTAITEVKTTIKQDPTLDPSAVTVTVQLEDEPMAEDLYKRRRIRNQKLAFRRQHVANRDVPHRLELLPGFGVGVLVQFPGEPQRGHRSTPGCRIWPGSFKISLIGLSTCLNFCNDSFLALVGPLIHVMTRVAL